MRFSIFTSCIILLLAFTACQKKDSSQDFWGKDKYEKDKEEKESCFDLDYPVTYIMPDDSEILVEDEKTMWTDIKKWYEANPDSKDKPALQYPVDIIYAGGSTLKITDEAAMTEAKKDCEEEELTCEWDDSKVADETIWESYVVEPLVESEECGCITEGVVKHVKIGTDFAYVLYYGKGDCDNWGHLVTYHDDEDKKVEKCKFEFTCEE